MVAKTRRKAAGRKAATRRKPATRRKAATRRKTTARARKRRVAPMIVGGDGLMMPPAVIVPTGRKRSASRKSTRKRKAKTGLGRLLDAIT
jgi:hypothetical protein